MNFGQAVDVLKTGGRAARAGWNGENMFIFLEKGVFPCGPRPDVIDGVDSDLFYHGEDGDQVVMPYLIMQTASGAMVTGWLASQTDILADDWKELISVELAFDMAFDMVVDPGDVLRASDEDFVDHIIAAINGAVGETAAARPVEKGSPERDQPESTVTFTVGGEASEAWDPDGECNCVACQIRELLEREGVI